MNLNNCEYCAGLCPNSIIESDLKLNGVSFAGIQVYVDDNEMQLLVTGDNDPDSPMVDVRKKIRYCPMCGRYLKQKEESTKYEISMIVDEDTLENLENYSDSSHLTFLGTPDELTEEEAEKKIQLWSKYRKPITLSEEQFKDIRNGAKEVLCPQCESEYTCKGGDE